MQTEINNSKNKNQPYELPPGWKWVTLGEVCKEIYRYPTYYNISYVSQGIPEVRGELIKENGSLESELTKYRFISNETSERYPRTVLREGDFVLSVRGSMGKVGLVPKELDGANMTANLIRISPNRAMVYSLFLKQVFLSEYFQRTLDNLSPQTTIKTIKAPILKSIKIPLPPLPEQRRIAAKIQELMEEVERARTACKKQLEAVKLLPSAYLREVFESEEAKKWERKRLGEVCEINPPRPKNFKRSPDAPTTFVPMESVNENTGSITASKIVPYSKVSKGYTYFEENDVLFAKITPCMQNGKHVIAKNLIDKIGFGTTEFHVLRPSEKIIPEWIWYFIRQPHFLKEATAYFTGAVGQQRIPVYFLSGYTIPLPPVEVQRRIAADLKEKMAYVEKLRTAIEKQLEAINALPQVILRKAFRGEL